jgi:hypothetical protein
LTRNGAGGDAFLRIPEPDLRVAPPIGQNRLYAAILSGGADIDALIGVSSQPHGVADVSALVRGLRAHASAFGAYDYRVEP